MDRTLNPPSATAVTPRSFPARSTVTPVSSQRSKTRESQKKTPAPVPVVGAKVLAWTTGKTGGPGKTDSFKVPKKLPTPTKKIAGKSKKKTVSKEDSGSREKEGREDAAMPGQARDARVVARAGVKRPLFSSSPTTVVKRIALQASKLRYQATVAQERPSLLVSSPSPVSSSQSPRHLQPGPSTAPVTVHDRNCRCLYSTNKSNHCPILQCCTLDPSTLQISVLGSSRPSRSCPATRRPSPCYKLQETPSSGLSPFCKVPH